MNLAFIGLGVMGYPMAGHLARAGHQVVVFNRTRLKAEQWVEQYAGKLASTPAEAASGAEIVFACVGNDDDLRAITLGVSGAFEGMRKNSLFIDHTTASADIARELFNQANAQGFSFLDAPVSGGQAGAENGQLAIMVGGDASDFARAKPVLDVYAKLAKLMGPAGSGQLTKMVNQICIAGLVQGLAEGLNFAQAAGLDGAEVVEVISQGAAQSWQMENRYQTMLRDEFDFGFAVDWMRKDLAIALAEASHYGAPLPITEIVDGYYAEIQAMGGHRWDTSSLISRLRSTK
ncbi:MAG: NAD(P)-dependent oxidoreductase [Pseudomonadales bacterium]|nr:NAD(P)-dependent oxidoreductase [Pseudomonadales bacterium]